MCSKDSVFSEKQQSNNRPAVYDLILYQMEYNFFFIQKHILTLFNHFLV